jgi:hypothetical protein
MFHMANDSRLCSEDRLRTLLRVLLEAGHGNVFCQGTQPEMRAVYEAKMIHRFDHRFGTYTVPARREAQANVGTLPGPHLERSADPCKLL